MNKTIFYWYDFSSVDYDYEFQMTVDVGVKTGGEAKIHLETQLCWFKNCIFSNLLDSVSKSVNRMTQARYKLKKDE